MLYLRLAGLLLGLALTAPAQNAIHWSSHLGENRWSMNQKLPGDLNWKKTPGQVVFVPWHTRSNKDWAKTKTISIPVDRVTRMYHSASSYLDPVAGANYQRNYLRIYWKDEGENEAGAVFELTPTVANPEKMLAQIQERVGKLIEEEPQAATR